MKELDDLLDILRGIDKGTEYDLTHNINTYICVKDKEYVLIEDKEDWRDHNELLH